MKKYREKSFPTFEAEQVTEEIFDPNNIVFQFDTPYGKLFGQNFRIKNKSLVIAGCTLIANLGDWLVRSNGRNYFVLTDEEFSKRFELIEE